MRAVFGLSLLLCSTGCMQFRDGWLGRDKPRSPSDAGVSEAGQDAEAEDEPDEEEEEGDTQDRDAPFAE